MQDSTRRRFIRTSSVVSIIGLTGCTQTGGNDAEGVEESDSPESDSVGKEEPSTETEEPEEEIPLSVSYTYGAESHRNYRWKDSQLTIEAGDKNAEESDFEGNLVDGHIVLSTKKRIDMSSVSQIEYTFQHTSTSHDQDASFFGISKERKSIRYKPVKYHVGEGGEDIDQEIIDAASNIDTALYNKDINMEEKQSKTIEVEDILGKRYLGIGVNLGSSVRQEMSLEVFSLQGFDTDGEQVFKLNFKKQSLILN